MSLQEFLSSVGLILAVMAALALLEAAAPLFARGAASKGRAAANVGLSSLTLLMSWALGSLAAVVALRASIDGTGLLAQLALPSAALVAISIVALDLCTYLAHRSMHFVPALWRAHRVHHSDPFLDVTTTLRQHPIEGLWRSAWILVPVWVLGLPVAGVFAYRLLSAVQAVFEHANIRVWPRFDHAVSVVWVTPNMHKVHHSRLREQTDSNYGNLFALFDRAFRTFRRSDEAFSVEYGLAEVDATSAKSFGRLMTMPFVKTQAESSSHAPPADRESSGAVDHRAQSRGR